MRFFLLFLLCLTANAFAWTDSDLAPLGTSCQNPVDAFTASNSPIRFNSKESACAFIAASHNQTLISVDNLCRTRTASGSDDQWGWGTESRCLKNRDNGCPSAGSDAGSKNITTAWTNGPSTSSKIVKPVIPDGGLGGKKYTSDSCQIEAGSPTACYISQTPSANGLYRVSCDVDFTYAGESSVAGDESAPVDGQPPPPPPPCPSGNNGTVNGVPVCLDPAGAPPYSGTPTPNKGNPNLGSKPDASKDSPYSKTEPSNPGSVDGSGTGGGPNGGGGGTNTNPTKSSRSNTPATGKGPATAGPDTPDGPKECGTPGRPKCQIDESGTPDGKADFQTATDKLNLEKSKIDAGVSEAASDQGKDTSLNWFPQLPEGECVDPTIPGIAGEGVTMEVCKHLPPISNGFNLLWACFYGFAIMGLVATASSKAHA